MHVLAIISLLGFTSGIIAAELSPYATELAVTCLGILCMQIGLHMVQRKIYAHEKREESSSLFSCALRTCLFSLMLVIGIVRVQLADVKENFVCESVCTFSGTILRTPESRGELQKVRVRLPDDRYYDVMITAPLYPTFHAGEKISVTGIPRIPKNMDHNPTENNFDYVSYLRGQGVGSEVYRPDIVVGAKHDAQENVIYLLARIKENFVEVLKLHVREPAASLASGMLFGSQDMSSDLITTFRTSGISHIIVLSGFNISILISAVLVVFSGLPLLAKVTASSLLVTLFVIMVGAEPSIVRAVIMSFISLLALLVGRQYHAKQALILSCIVLLMYQPESLLSDPSLHLSFLATAGIVYGKKLFDRTLDHFSLGFYKEIISTTLAAYMATLPYIMWSFGTVSVYALLTNVLVLPLVSLIMLLSFLTIIFGLSLEVLGVFFGASVSVLAGIIILVARWVEGLPFSSIEITLSLQFMVVLYLLQLALYLYCERAVKNETLLTKSNEKISDVISY